MILVPAVCLYSGHFCLPKGALFRYNVPKYNILEVTCLNLQMSQSLKRPTSILAAELQAIQSCLQTGVKKRWVLCSLEIMNFQPVLLK